MYLAVDGKYFSLSDYAVIWVQTDMTTSLLDHVLVTQGLSTYTLIWLTPQPGNSVSHFDATFPPHHAHIMFSD